MAKKKKIRSAAYIARHNERRKHRLAVLKAKYKSDPDRPKFRICKHKRHVGFERRVPAVAFDKKTKFCSVCLARDRYRRKASLHLKKVAMARANILNAIAEGKLGQGTMKDFAMESLRIFGGVPGLVQHLKTEFDAADEGSLIRKQYLELIVKVLVAMSAAGQDEDLEQVPDAELAARIEAARKDAADQLLK